MTDVPSSLGIEAVECLAEDARPRTVTVRVTGRWRRRRPELRGQPMLVIDAESGRQRFLAMPEPPSLAGAPPGTWRMSFSVPAELAPSLPGRTFLQLGGAMVPLPIGDVPTPGEPAEVSETDLLEARRARGSELAAESARRQATELAADLARLERELDEAQAQSERLRDELADRDRRLRSAEQHVHSERALRAEVEEQLSRRSRTAQHDLGVLHERVAELERELTRMRRAVDEAQHLAAAAEAARADAVRRLSEQRLPSPRSPQAEPTRRELELSRASPGAPGAARPAAPPAERTADRVALRQEAAMAGYRGAGPGVDAARLAALERELAAAHEEIALQRGRSARAWEAIEFVRAELRQVRATAATPPPSSPPQPQSGGEPAASAGEVRAEHLSAALARLREQAPPTPAEPPGPAPVEPPAPAPVEPPGPVAVEPPAPPPAEPPAPPPAEPPALAPAEPLAPSRLDPAPAPGATRPWIGVAFRKLAARDSSTAGRLLLGLLPAQHAADPHPVAYDLVMSDVLVAQVTVGSAGSNVALDATRRSLPEVDFQLVGDLARIARLLAAGPVGRRLGRLAPGRPVARVRGDRRRLAALDALLGARLTLAQLHAAGVRLDPLLALTLAGVMAEPAWTAGERFTLGHREAAAPAPDAYLLVRDGRPPLASGESPHGSVATVVVCPGDQLLAVLGGAVAPAEVAGDQRPLAVLRQWLDRAQCG